MVMFTGFTSWLAVSLTNPSVSLIIAFLVFAWFAVVGEASQ